MKLLVTFVTLCAASVLATPFASAQTDDRKPSWNVNQPPGPARTATLDVRRGTWMSVDVSPDGRTIVFDLLGDLYRVPIEGGDATPLTHSIAWEQQPRFSPDGRRIAFLSDAGGGDNVWVMNVDGTEARAVTKEDFRLLNNPVWHPSGRFIFARKHYTGTRSAGSGEIWLYHVDGGKGLQLNEKPTWQKDLGEPAVSPDGRFLYWSQDVTPGRTFEYNKDSNKEIFRIFRQDLHDGSVEPFVVGAGGAVRPTPSPDGKWLAFVRRVRGQSTLMLKDLATGRETAAWSGLERDLQETWSVNGVYPAMAWTPDAKQVVAWAQGRLWRVDPFKGTATEIPFHVRDTRELRESLRVPQAVSPDRFPVRQLRSAEVSPDGRRVAYSALGSVWIKDLPDGTPHRLTRQDDRFEFFPSFARDGRSVVFTTWHDERLGSVRRVDLASGRETVLVSQPGKYASPRLSPDGRRVAFVKQRGGWLTTPWQGTEYGVYVAQADGAANTLQRVSKDGESPQWGERNDAIYVQRTQFTGEVDFVRRLVRVALDAPFDGTREIEVAKSEFATDFTVSPDGRWLGFVERFHAFVTPLPLAGKVFTVGPKMDALPVRQLDTDAGQSLHFGGDSDRLHWTLGDTLYTAPVPGSFVGTPAKSAPTAQRIGFDHPTDRPNGRIAFVGARVATMRGAAADEVIDDATIVVDGPRIAAIGPSSQVAVPPDAMRVDVRGKTIVPGFIDAHWHGSMGEGGMVPQQSWIGLASLALGVTTIHDPSNRNDHIFQQAELQRAGLVTGPRIYSTGGVLYGAKSPYAAVIDKLDDATMHVKRQQAEGAISVKSYQQPRRDQRQQILEAARQAGMMVVPEGGSLFQQNMSMLVDGHTTLEHALPLAEVYDDVVQLWRQAGTAYTPTLNVAYGGMFGEEYWYQHTEVWKHPILSALVPESVLRARGVRRTTAPDEEHNVLRVARTAVKLAREGVVTSIGAHGQREGLGAHWEMWMFALGGMKPIEALRTATLNPAQALGLDRDIGALDVGKLADLVVIEGDVLADIRASDRITHVMQNGRLYAVPSMNEIVSRERRRAPLFFDGAAGVGMPVDPRGAGEQAEDD